jgi:hypothetical protein
VPIRRPTQAIFAGEALPRQVEHLDRVAARQGMMATLRGPFG